LRIGLVGCGRAAIDLHLPAIARVGGLRVVVAADPDAAALATAVRSAPDVRGYDDPRRVIDDPGVDLVAVCVPSFLHADVACAALAAGKHVYLEKPLCVTPEDAARIRAASQGARGRLALGFNLRSHRLVRAARTLVAGGAIGVVELVHTAWTCGFQLGHPWPAWRLDRDRGGGAFQEIAVHHLDLLRYLLGDEIASVAAQTHSAEMVDQSIAIVVRMRSGVVASLAVTQRSADGNELAICGRDGIVEFSCYRADSLRVRRSADPGGGVGPWLRERVAWLRAFPAAMAAGRAGGDFRLSYAAHWQAVSAAIRDGSPMPATLEDGERALAAVRAAIESAERGVRVEVAP
jgi:myo-inositol 2-dehydrogenase/D-chiro-inositol 1-dehydrogenase